MSGLGRSCRLFSIDLRSLAIFRIGVATIILCDLFALRFPDINAFYVDDGLYSRADAVAWFGGKAYWSLCLLGGSPEFQAIMFGLTAVFALLLLIGWWTRLATICCWVMVVSIANRNPLVCNYGDTLLIVFLFWSMFLPLGGKWSLDAWRRPPPADRYPNNQVCSGASFAALAQLSIVYVFTGIWKWNSSWLTGSALEEALALEYARRAATVDWLSFQPILRPLTMAALWLELLGPLAVWIPWRNGFFRFAMVACFVTLHVSIEILFTPVQLSYVCMVAWLLFLPEGFWEHPFISRLYRHTPANAVDSASPADANGNGSNLNIVGGYWLRRLADVCCLLLLTLVLLWNAATLNPQQLGFLVPKQIRWVGHVTMLGQTWDMFFRPSLHNGWFKARTRLANQDIVDALRDGEPYDAESVKSSWSYFKNSRWKIYFRRLGVWKELESTRPHVAEYLMREWNEQQPEDRRALELSLMYYERFDEEEGAGYSSRQVATVGEREQLDWKEQMLQRMNAIHSGAFPE